MSFAVGALEFTNNLHRRTKWPKKQLEKLVQIQAVDLGYDASVDR